MRKSFIVITILSILTLGVALADGPAPVVADGQHGTLTWSVLPDGSFAWTIDWEDGSYTQSDRSVPGNYLVSLYAPTWNEAAETGDAVRVLRIDEPLSSDTLRSAVPELLSTYDALFFEHAGSPLLTPMGGDVEHGCTLKQCVDGAIDSCDASGAGVDKLDWEKGGDCKFHCSDGSHGDIDCQTVQESQNNHDLEAQQQ